MHLLSVFSLRNRALIALITIVIGVFGFVALSSLKQELIPSIQLPSVYVVTSDPGASPSVVSHDISTPIETALQGIENLDSTTATSSTNSSTVTASFNYGADVATYEQKVQVAIDRISSTLPSGVTPQVITFSTTDLPIISLAVTSDLDKHTLASKLSTLTLTNLKQLDGVSNVSLLGAVSQRITITPDATTLAKDGLTVQSIKSALAANGTLLASGSITENGKTLTVQSGSKVSTVATLRTLPLIGTTSAAVGTPGHSTVVTTPKVYSLSDVATIARVDDPVTGYSRVNGKPSVTLSITKTSDGNTVAVSKEVKEAIPSLEKQLGSNTKFTVVTDQAPSITTSINSLAEEGLLGLGFAVIVIFVFLFSIRSTIVAAISIPISVLITFVGMLAAGYTLNIITLAGLTIAIGRVVDDSIVVIENIKRHLSLGENKLPAILAAVREVAVAVTASTITTVAVFLPIALVSGLTGELFRPFAVTVTIALAASLFVALTIVPVLAYWFLRSPNEVRIRQPRSVKLLAGSIALVSVALAAALALIGGVVIKRNNAGDAQLFVGTVPLDIVAGALIVGLIVLIVYYTRLHIPRSIVSVPSTVASTANSSADELDAPTRLQRGYLPVIRWTLKFPAIVLIGAVVILLGSGLLAKTSLTTNFIGNSGQNTLTVTQTLGTSASLAAQDEASRPVESTLRGIKGVTTVEVSIGSGGNSLRAAFSGGGATTFDVTTDPKADQDKLLTTITSKMKAIKDEGTIKVSAASSGLTSSNIEIDVSAGSSADLNAASKALIAKAEKIKGVSSVTSNLAASLPYIGVVIDRQAAANHGLTELQVGSEVAQAMNPSSTGNIVVGDTTLDIYIEDAGAPTTIEALKAYPIATATGSTVPLSDLATVKTVNGPSSVTTIKGLQTATIEVVPSTSNVGNLSSLVQTSVDTTTLPASATATLGGFTTQQGDAFSQLGLALLAAILIVYVVMVAAFKSLRQPLLLLVSIPFAATGAIVLQVLSGVPLGVASLIGVLMLVGIVVTNAIVLVDLINQYRTRGMKVADAIVHGASRRLRPILMTALATIFALLPLGLGLSGHGSFISQPLAIIVIGGLVSSTLLTLVVLPVLYYLVEGAKERREDRRTASKAEQADPARISA